MGRNSVLPLFVAGLLAVSIGANAFAGGSVGIGTDGVFGTYLSGEMAVGKGTTVGGDVLVHSSFYDIKNYYGGRVRYYSRPELKGFYIGAHLGAVGVQFWDETNGYVEFKLFRKGINGGYALAVGEKLRFLIGTTYDKLSFNKNSTTDSGVSFAAQFRF